MTVAIAVCAVGLVCLALGWALRGMAEDDRRIKHAPPTTITPSLKQLRSWDDERKSAGLRVLRGGRR